MNKVVQYGVATVLLALVFGLPAGYVGGVFSRTPTAVVDNKEGDEVPASECAIGELIQLKAQGTNAAWTIEPASVDAISFGTENEHFAASFRESGRYVVIAASVVNKKVVIVKTVFNVGGGHSPSPTNEPIFLDRFKTWSPGPTDQARALAASFRTVSSFVSEKLDAGTLVTPEKILQMTTESNQRVLGVNSSKWSTFFTSLQTELDHERTGGSLTTQRDFVHVWNDIAEALDAL